MNEELTKKMSRWMYFLIKGAARDSYADFLEDMNLSSEEYEEIKKAFKDNFNIELYI